MQKKHTGNQTICFGKPVYIVGRASAAGPEECKGPLKKHFHICVPDALWGEESFEKAEQKIFEQTVKRAIQSAGKKPQDMDFLVGGDLLNQIISAGYSARELGIPFLGIYGACSTMAQSMIMGAMLVDGNFADYAVCATSSHYATAERQFRFPVELGTPKTPTSQNTVTGGGACVLAASGEAADCLTITGATVGCVVDLGIKDANNMGAAMAPAALETILTHFEDTGKSPADYDMIVTGDLGTFGSELLVDMANKMGVDLSSVHQDCGSMIFEGVPDSCCGGSGCGCGAAVLNGYLLNRMQEGALQRLLFVATGAMLSPTSIQQGESVPSVAHAVVIERSNVQC